MALCFAISAVQHVADHQSIGRSGNQRAIGLHALDQWTHSGASNALFRTRWSRADAGESGHSSLSTSVARRCGVIWLTDAVSKWRSGTQATDLGAAPGGWTWVLIRQHLRVTSIDNAALRPPLLNHPLVQHVRADGFAGHRHGQWIGWSATWLNSHVGLQNVWLSGCVKGGVGTCDL